MKLKSIVTIVGFVVLIVVMFYIVFEIRKYEKIINYNYSYKDMVRKTVKEMVKQECLK